MEDQPQDSARTRTPYLRRWYLAKLRFVAAPELDQLRDDRTTQKGTCRICGLILGAIQKTHLKEHERLYREKQEGLLPNAFPLGATAEHLKIKTPEEYKNDFGFSAGTSLISEDVHTKMRTNLEKRGIEELAAKARAARRGNKPPSMKGRTQSKEFRQRRAQAMLGKAQPKLQEHGDGEIARLFLLEQKSAEEIGDELGYRPKVRTVEGREIRSNGTIRKRLARIFGVRGLYSIQQLIHGDPGSGAWLSAFRQRFGDAPNEHLAERLNMSGRHLWNVQRRPGQAVTPEFAEASRQCEIKFIEALMCDGPRGVKHFKGVIPALTEKVRAAGKGIDLLLMDKFRHGDALEAICHAARDEVAGRIQGFDARATLCWLPALAPWLTANPKPPARRSKDHAVRFVAHIYRVNVWVVQNAAYSTQVQASGTGEIRALLFPPVKDVGRPKGMTEDRIQEAKELVRLISEDGKRGAQKRAAIKVYFGIGEDLAVGRAEKTLRDYRKLQKTRKPTKTK